MLGVVGDKVSQTGAGVELQFHTKDGPRTVEAEMLLVATGRRPNGAALGVAATGVELDRKGRVVVDEYQRTGVDGIYALGDISTEHQLKHVANHEATVVRHNLAHPDAPIRSDHRFVPAAVFTDPQIAAVGLTEQQAHAHGIPFAVKKQEYGGIAAGWAREDTTHFLKVLADPATGLLLGAHVIGPEAATVIQPLIQGMSFGQTAHDVARGQYWIHPALSELVENALLGLPAPTGSDPELSCADDLAEHPLRPCRCGRHRRPVLAAGTTVRPGLSAAPGAGAGARTSRRPAPGGDVGGPGVDAGRPGGSHGPAQRGRR